MSQLAEHLEIGRKVQLQAALFQIVIFDPNQGIEKLGIDRLDVFGGEFLVQHSFVERQRESRVDEASVIQSLETQEPLVIQKSYHPI